MKTSGEIIVGVDKVLQEINWNKKSLRWTVTHSTDQFTRQHEIQLDMTIVSSERVVSVDGTAKLKQMCSFGLKCEFDISEYLRGKIVQDGMQFELYLNGKSFTQCSKQNYSYQPPEVVSNFTSNAPPWGLPPKKTTSSPPLKQTLSQGPTIPEKLPENHITIAKVKSSESEVKTEDSLKNMQSQAMKILISQKKAKKDSAKP